MSSDQRLLRLEKRHKGLARVTAAINDLYIYGVYESNFPALMEKLNEAKEKEQKEYEKAKRGSKGPSSINPPSFAKSPPKSPKR